MLTNKRFGKKDDIADVHREKAPGQLALELDANLRRLSTMHNQTRYLMGVTLSILRDKDAYQRMGYTNLASFSAQELGMQAGQSHEIARNGKELRHRPTTLFRHLTGQISFGALRWVLSATPRELEDQTSALFVGLTVGQTEEMAAEFLRFYDEACAAAAAARGEEAKPEPKKRKKRASEKPDDPRVGELARRLAEGGHAVGGNGAFESPESEEGRMIELDASPGLAARFFVGLELARCIEGADLPVHACLEMWMAEMMSGEGSDALQKMAREDPQWFLPRAPSHDDDDAAQPPVPDPMRAARNLERALDRAFNKEVEREIHLYNDSWAFLDWTLPQIEKLDHLTPNDDMTLEELRRRLRALRELDLRVDKLLREGLWRFKRARLYLELDFVSIGHYGEERLRMSRSTAKFLVSLEHRLQRFDHIRAALDSGLLKENQAALLVIVATPESEEAWIAHARQTTVRFLRDDINEAQQMAVFDPERFDRTHGIPSKRRIRLRGGQVKTKGRRPAGRGAATGEGGDEAAGSGQTCEAGGGERGRTGAGQTCEAGGGGEHATAGAGQTCEVGGGGHAASAAGQTCEVGGGGHAASAAGQTCADGRCTHGEISEAGTSHSSRKRQPRNPLPLPEFRKRLQLVVNDVNGCYDEDPFQGAKVRLQMWIPSSLEAFLQDAMDTTRLVLGGWGGFNEGLEVCLDAFLSQYGDEALQALRKHPILARDGCRCAVPTCGRRGTLHVHHIQFRSRGGGNAPFNLVTLCEAHHLQGVHKGYIRVTGECPDDVLWELGMQPDGSCDLKVEGRTILEQDIGLAEAA